MPLWGRHFLSFYNAAHIYCNRLQVDSEEGGFGFSEEDLEGVPVTRL